MSPQGNQPGAQVTGNEDEQFQQFLRDEVAKAVAANQQTQTQQPPPAAATQQPPITLSLANGQTASFNSPAELNQFFQNFQAQAQAAITQAQQTQTQQNEVTGNEAPDFSVDQFVEQVTKDPKMAVVSALKAAGYDLDGLVEDRKKLKELNDVLAVQQFKSAFPDFPENPAAAQIVNQVRQQLNLPFSAQGLAASYAVADKQGMFQNFRQQQQQQAPPVQQGPNQQPNPYGNGQPVYGQQPMPMYGNYNPYQQNGPSAPPPRLPPAGYQPPVDDYAVMAENLSTDQIEQLFDRFSR